MTAPFFARKTLEKTVEAKAVAYAKSRGWWTSKFVAPGLRGVPDRIFIRQGRTLFIEFKQAGATPSTQQLRRHAELAGAGATVAWCDSFEAAAEVLL